MVLFSRSFRPQNRQLRRALLTPGPENVPTVQQAKHAGLVHAGTRKGVSESEPGPVVPARRAKKGLNVAFVRRT